MSCHVFFLFAPAFRDWPFLISEEIKELTGRVEVSGLVTGQENTHRHVSQRARAAGFAPFDHLAALEADWVSTPVENRRLEQYEAMLGADAIQKLVISDRHVGAGYVSGGRMPETALGRLSFDADIRRRYIVGMLDYLLRALEGNKPDLVFCYAVAGAPAYALAMLSEYLDIPFLRLTHSRIGARHVVDSSPLGLMAEVADIYRRSECDPAIVADSIEPARDFIRQFRERATAPEYIELFHKNQKLNLSTWRLIREIVSILKPIILPYTKPKTPNMRQPTRWQRARHRAASWLSARRTVKSDIFCPQETLPTSNYIFFPLHFDPEASTMVFAPYHTDQTNVVEMLAKATPASMTVVVKEHIPMIGLRPAGFYQRLKRIPGVVLASPACSSFELIRSADLTVAITGTAAWEALLLSKRTITIGQAPFNAISAGIRNCPDLTQLPKAIAAALKETDASDDPLTRYLAAILKLSFNLPYKLLWTSVTEAEVAKHRSIARTIAEQIIAKVRIDSRTKQAGNGSAGD